MVNRTTVHRFEPYWSFDPEQDVKRLNRTVVERKHIGLIIQRTQDQNLAVRVIFSSLAQRKSAGPFKPEAARSKLAAAFGQPVIAQLVERLTVDQLVACSTQADGISSQRVRKNSLPFWSYSSAVERTIAVRLVGCSIHPGSFGRNIVDYERSGVRSSYWLRAN